MEARGCSAKQFGGARRQTKRNKSSKRNGKTRVKKYRGNKRGGSISLPTTSMRPSTTLLPPTTTRVLPPLAPPTTTQVLPPLAPPTTTRAPQSAQWTIEPMELRTGYTIVPAISGRAVTFSSLAGKVDGLIAVRNSNGNGIENRSGSDMNIGVAVNFTKPAILQNVSFRFILLDSLTKKYSQVGSMNVSNVSAVLKNNDTLYFQVWNRNPATPQTTYKVEGNLKISR